MNRRHLIRTLALTALGTSASLAANAETKRRPLRVGESLQFDEGMRITFVAVARDRRCPINAQCLTAGDAVVVLRVQAGNQPAKTVRIHTNLKPRKVIIPANQLAPGVIGIPKSYVIGIARLTPLPTAGKITLQADYRLGLEILVAL